MTAPPAETDGATIVAVAIGHGALGDDLIAMVVDRADPAPSTRSSMHWAGALADGHTPRTESPLACAAPEEPALFEDERPEQLLRTCTWSATASAPRIAHP